MYDHFCYLPFGRGGGGGGGESFLRSFGRRGAKKEEDHVTAI